MGRSRARAESVDGVPVIGIRQLRDGLAVVAIRLTSPAAPALARQERVGRCRRPFTAYRFRTTPVDRAVGAHPVGRLLHRTGLDALPRLLDVLKGDMSLVGPRPRSAWLDERGMREVPRCPERRQVRPGLTGWAEANALPDGTRIAEQVVYDLYYIENWSLGMDLRILLLTALRLVARPDLVEAQPVDVVRGHAHDAGLARPRRARVVAGAPNSTWSLTPSRTAAR